MQVNNSLSSFNVVSGYKASSTNLMPRVSAVQNSQCDSLDINFKGANSATVRKGLFERMFKLSSSAKPCPFKFDFPSLAELQTRLSGVKTRQGVIKGKPYISIPTQDGGEMTYHYRKDGTLKWALEKDAQGRKIADYEVKSDGRTPDTIWSYDPYKDEPKAVFSFSRDNTGATVFNGADRTMLNLGKDGQWRIYDTKQEYAQFPTEFFDLKQLSLLQQ